jgi:rubrerythrin
MSFPIESDCKQLSNPYIQMVLDDKLRHPEMYPASDGTQASHSYVRLTPDEYKLQHPEMYPATAGASDGTQASHSYVRLTLDEYKQQHPEMYPASAGASDGTQASHAYVQMTLDDKQRHPEMYPTPAPAGASDGTQTSHPYVQMTLADKQQHPEMYPASASASDDTKTSHSYVQMTLDDKQQHPEMYPEATVKQPVDANKFNYKSFKASSFEELDMAVEKWLREVGKRMMSISCWFDGHHHYAMLCTNPTEVIICSGPGYNQAVVSQDGKLWVRSM